MKAKRRYIPNFDARSVMIIAAWAFGSAAAQAQTPATPPRPNPLMTAPAAAMDPPPASKADAAAAFNRADVNHDGKLTREEAAAIPWLAEHFDEIDTGHKGFITREQYDKAMG